MTDIAPAASTSGTQYTTNNLGFNWRAPLPNTRFNRNATADVTVDVSLDPNSPRRGWAIFDQVMDPTNSWSLPRLSEVHPDREGADRLYSPHDASRVCAADPLGESYGPRQSHGWAWAHEGAQSYLLEVQRSELDEVGVLIERCTRGGFPISVDGRVVACTTGDPVFADFWWSRSRTEAEVRSVTRDNFYPLGRLVSLAGNPIGSSPDRDAAVVSLTGSTPAGSCDVLHPYQVGHGHRFDGEVDSLGPIGQVNVSCELGGWGQAATRVRDAEIIIEDRTLGTVTTRHLAGAQAVSGTHHTFSAVYDFEAGHDYVVQCEILAAYETEDQWIEVTNSAGCKATSGGLEQCEVDDAVFKTNNRRMLTFRAEHPVESVCSDLSTVSRTPSGYNVSAVFHGLW